MSNFIGENIVDIVYFEHAATGTGNSPDDRLPIVSITDFMENMAGDVNKQFDVVIEVAVTGSTALDVGDPVDPNGYVEAADITLATPAVYPGTGALLPDRPGVQDIELLVTGTSTAGKFHIVRRGYRT